MNVVRCEMALVGPAPESEERVLRWKDLLPEYDRRFTVLPGVTGIAQLCGGSGMDAESIALQCEVLERVAVEKPEGDQGRQNQYLVAVPVRRGESRCHSIRRASCTSGSMRSSTTHPPSASEATMRCSKNGGPPTCM